MYNHLIPKMLNIEWTLIAQGGTPTHLEHQDNQTSTSYNEKPRTWATNKNVTNDGVVDAKVVISALKQNTQTYQQPQNNNWNNMQENAVSQPSNNQINNLNNQGGPSPWNKYAPKQKYTNLGESIESVMKKMVKKNLIKIPTYENYQEPQVKPPWYNENHLCDFRKIKGHTTANCMRLKNIIQDLIDEKIINVEQPAGNQDLKIYMNPMPDHNKGNNKGKKKYVNVNHVYNHFSTYLDEWVTSINIKGAKFNCGVTTHNEKITIVGSLQPPRASTSNPKSIPSGYNILD